MDVRLLLQGHGLPSSFWASDLDPGLERDLGTRDPDYLPRRDPDVSILITHYQSAIVLRVFIFFITLKMMSGYVLEMSEEINLRTLPFINLLGGSCSSLPSDKSGEFMGRRW
ncbi:uncharacterized protein LOC124167040 [Ischnura elegans]|uniref:uncharacterized protein LOC124167040 n=1 Tax=Ischnura elegans TaxID=197161 RepID=UPI001ED8B7C7|nr:uncharacterized protein LOC124167040 [Ischnura elegans]